MADPRTYVKVHDGLPDHPKIIEVGGEAAWLYVSALCYSSRQLTDGVIGRRLMGRLTDLANSEALASALLRVGLLHEGSHDCPKCPLAEGDVYVIHDYLDHQRSAEQVRELRAKRSAAGQRGGRRSGQVRRGEANGEANAEALASRLLKQTRSKSEAETETETETEVKELVAASPRLDVERLCQLLADLVEANGSKRPRVTKAWRDAARLLIDKDGRTAEQVATAIEWSQKDGFWRSNILSMPKLRDKYDQLRLSAMRGNGSAQVNVGHQPYQPPEDYDYSRQGGF